MPEQIWINVISLVSSLGSIATILYVASWLDKNQLRVNSFFKKIAIKIGLIPDTKHSIFLERTYED